MPEGHTIHRAARDQTTLFAGQALRVSSPQGRFAEGAAALDRAKLTSIGAFGKHLLYRFAKRPTLHVHLGLYGDFYAHAKKDAPEPRATTRVRFVGKTHVLDLIGPNQCELLDDEAVERLLARLGPDPLNDSADRNVAWERIHASRVAIGQLLMDQSVISGVGNIYRAEVLWLLKVAPMLPGNRLSREAFDAIWSKLVELMHVGMEYDRIITVPLDSIAKPIDKLSRGERFNIYKLDDCPRCGGRIATSTMAGRTVYSCDACQPNEPEQEPKIRRKFPARSSR